MLYKKLKGALDTFCDTCEKLQIDYVPSYEESDLQSVLLSTKDHHVIHELEDELEEKIKTRLDSFGIQKSPWWYNSKPFY